MNTPSDRLRTAISRIDAANAADPHLEEFAGEQHPAELLYGRRMSGWLDRFAPDAPEAVQLACRAQHIERWKIPRNSYPMDRDGYRRWRTDLGKFHAETASRILREVGYDEETIGRAQSLLRKERLKADPDCQLLEDVVCLVFLDHYASDFVAQHKDDEEKLVNIFRRTWKKISDAGRNAALGIDLPPALRRIIEKALAA